MSSFFLFYRFDAPSFMKALPLYSLPVSLHPRFPLVDYVDDLLDACPDITLLEVLDVAVRLNIPILASFPHKSDQGIRCRTFNVVVVVFFSDIS